MLTTVAAGLTAGSNSPPEVGEGEEVRIQKQLGFYNPFCHPKRYILLGCAPVRAVMMVCDYVLALG